MTAAAGLSKTLHITAGSTALLGAMFFLGYFFFQIPGAHYAETKSAKKEQNAFAHPVNYWNACHFR
ncbi:hypothetical protein BXT84_10585 [Sulfobacillus thermotolerans]|uniref:Uncharacterized protein n=1 Tax=Sulfobacillus thermotolerans TaxID=338644 RepID=A0ABM6RSE1_9FIRM|nr:hypothetical protein BXT84_10585 [Sulfobacillus thermotolerans]